MIKIYWHQEVMDVLLLIKLFEILMCLGPGAAISLDLNNNIQEIVNLFGAFISQQNSYKSRSVHLAMRIHLKNR
jgi:hypothetical protein